VFVSGDDNAHHFSCVLMCGSGSAKDLLREIVDHISGETTVNELQSRLQEILDAKNPAAADEPDAEGERKSSEPLPNTRASLSVNAMAHTVDDTHGETSRPLVTEPHAASDH